MRVKSLESRVESQSARLLLRPHSGSRLSTLDSRFRRRGMTLIELLVVIVILVTVVAAAIPIMAPSNVDRQLRETTRALNTYITGAQAHAVATGRPYGIALKRLAQETDNNNNLDDPHEDNGVCLEVFYVEEQPPFTGFDRSSRVCVSLIPNIGLICVQFVTRGNQSDPLPTGWDADLFPSGMIQPGDVIEIGDSRFELLDHRNNQLLRYTQQYVRVGFDKTNIYFEPQPNAPVQIIARPINDTGQQIYPEYDNAGYSLGEDRPPTPPAPARPPAPYWSRPVPYKILRQGSITSDEPYQLPEGTAIDLRASGVGNNIFFHNPQPTDPANRVDNSRPVIIMFTPEGRIARVSFNRSATTSTSAFSADRFDESVVDNVFLLVGRRENIPTPDADTADPTLNPTKLDAATTEEQRAELRKPINWLNGESLWVVIGSQSGRVVTVENSFVNLADFAPTPFANEDKRNGQILAAREFTREMSQLGGR
jgi:prepilin-type N-terminal cleavage/methylation domain-containing protein